MNAMIWIACLFFAPIFGQAEEIGPQQQLINAVGIKQAALIRESPAPIPIAKEVKSQNTCKPLSISVSIPGRWSFSSDILCDDDGSKIHAITIGTLGNPLRKAELRDSNAQSDANEFNSRNPHTKIAKETLADCIQGIAKNGMNETQRGEADVVVDDLLSDSANAQQQAKDDMVLMCFPNS